MTTFERVKETATRRGFKSLRTLAEKSGLSQNVIYGWKTQQPRVNNLQAVANTLGVSTDYLLGKIDDEFPDKNSSDVDIEEVLSVDYLKKHSVSFGGKPMTEHDAKAIIEVYRAMHEGRD